MEDKFAVLIPQTTQIGIDTAFFFLKLAGNVLRLCVRWRPNKD